MPTFQWLDKYAPWKTKDLRTNSFAFAMIYDFKCMVEFSTLFKSFYLYLSGGVYLYSLNQGFYYADTGQIYMEFVEIRYVGLGLPKYKTGNWLQKW